MKNTVWLFSLAVIGGLSIFAFMYSERTGSESGTTGETTSGEESFETQGNKKSDPLGLFVCSPNGWVLECGYDGCSKESELLVTQLGEGLCATNKPKDTYCKSSSCAVGLVQCNGRCVEEGACKEDQGDSIIDTFEECASEPVECVSVDTCGDGIQDAGEDCDGGALCTSACECPAGLISCNGGCSEPGYCGVAPIEACSIPTQPWAGKEGVCLCGVPELFCQEGTTCESDKDCASTCPTGKGTCLQPGAIFPSSCDGNSNCFYEESCSGMCS